MSFISRLTKLIDSGFPPEVAEKIASGELPMDRASRMERAREQGYDPDDIQLHGGGADISQFKTSEEGMLGPGVYTTSSQTLANEFAGVLPDGRATGREGGVIYPVLTRGDEANRFTGFRDYVRRNPQVRVSELAEDFSQQRQNLDKTGIDDFLGRQPVRNTFDPSDIRSVNAAFDPDYKGSNILGSAVPVALGTGIALLGSGEAEAAEALEPVEPGYLDRASDILGGALTPDISPEGVVGRLETAAMLASSVPAFVAGIGGLLKDLAIEQDPKKALETYRQIQDKLTYLPKTEGGIERATQIGELLEPLGEAYEAYGEGVGSLTGSPLTGQYAEEFLDPLMAIPPLAAATKLRKSVKAAPEGARAMSLPNQFLTQGGGKKATTPVVGNFTPKNTEQVLNQIETARLENPQALTSPKSWLALENQAFGGDYVPMPPMRAIEYNQRPDKLAGTLKQLRPEMKAAVDEGFNYVNQIRDLYNSGRSMPEMTGRLFTWGILSRGAGPVQQEAAFIDILDDAQPFIEKAARGEFTEADLDDWKKSIAGSLPEGSPARQVTMNVNAAGKLLLELGKVPEGSNQSVLNQLHNLLADPNATGREFRREFFRLTDKPGIDNKVVSFIGLVGGKDDMLVMDRIQTSNLWDDGRYDGKNIYDPQGGGLSAVMGGPRGLLITEALEDGLQNSVKEAYEMIGRPEDASLGRAHWETWVVRGNQAVSHSTLESVRTGTPIGSSVFEGKLGTFSAGTTYRQTANGPIVEYPLSDGSIVRMTPDKQKEFEAFIKNSTNGIVPSGFKVSQSTDKPWYESTGVNREKLDETARRFENANPDGSLRSGAPRAEQGGRSISERRADFLRAVRADRVNLSGRPDGRDSRGPSATYQRKTGSDDGGAGFLELDPNQDRALRYQSAGLNVPPLRQQPPGTQVEYLADMQEALKDNPAREQVYIPEDPDELATANFFRTDNGSGFAVKEDGDVTAVFAGADEPSGSAYAMLEGAIQAGGRKLDAFDTYLPKIYETVGFRPVAKIPWDDKEAPKGWDKEKYAEFNDGEPDVIFFVYDPDYFGKNGAKDLPYSKSYDEAVEVQNEALTEIADRVKEVEGFRRGGSVGLDALPRPTFYETTPVNSGIGVLPKNMRQRTLDISGGLGSL